MSKNKVLGLLGTLACFLAGCSGREEMPARTPAVSDTVISKQRNNNNYTSDCAKLKTEAAKFDSILLSSTEPDLKTADNAMNAFTEFASYCHNDPASPVYLIKTAQVASSMGHPTRAQQALQICIDEYPDFKDRPAALFMLARLHDEHKTASVQKIREMYDQIIREYPASEWAANAKAAMKVIGKSDEELIREFSKREKKV